MRPAKAPEFTPEEEEEIARLEDECATFLETHAEATYNTNESLGTSDHLRDEVWDELVKRAKKAGYIATRLGANVTVKNPPHR
jgi:hypothetical protein